MNNVDLRKDINNFVDIKKIRVGSLFVGIGPANQDSVGYVFKTTADHYHVSWIPLDYSDKYTWSAPFNAMVWEVIEP
jgi:hypothetical protein